MVTLDIGCGFINRLHQKRGDIGIDLHRGICDIVAEAENLPFKGAVFDEIFIFSVLEHLDNPMKCLQDSIRVAKDNAGFEFLFPVESRKHIVALRRCVLEFPFGPLAVLFECYRDWKHKPPPHKNRIHPNHIAQVFTIECGY